MLVLPFVHPFLYHRTKTSLALSWFVNTNEDVGDFRLELASLSQDMPKTVLVKDISYNTRWDLGSKYRYRTRKF